MIETSQSYWEVYVGQPVGEDFTQLAYTDNNSNEVTEKITDIVSQAGEILRKYGKNTTIKIYKNM